ncbi:hypothetical protein ADUPG1_006384, partial [Aduncisulcus paluster]
MKKETDETSKELISRVAEVEAKLSSIEHAYQIAIDKSHGDLFSDFSDSLTKLSSSMSDQHKDLLDRVSSVSSSFSTQQQECTLHIANNRSDIDDLTIKLSDHISKIEDRMSALEKAVTLSKKESIDRERAYKAEMATQMKEYESRMEEKFQLFADKISEQIKVLSGPNESLIEGLSSIDKCTKDVKILSESVEERLASHFEKAADIHTELQTELNDRLDQNETRLKHLLSQSDSSIQHLVKSHIASSVSSVQSTLGVLTNTITTSRASLQRSISELDHRVSINEDVVSSLSSTVSHFKDRMKDWMDHEKDRRDGTLREFQGTMKITESAFRRDVTKVKESIDHLKEEVELSLKEADSLAARRHGQLEENISRFSQASRTHMDRSEKLMGQLGKRIETVSTRIDGDIKDLSSHAKSMLASSEETAIARESEITKHIAQERTRTENDMKHNNTRLMGVLHTLQNRLKKCEENIIRVGSSQPFLISRPQWGEKDVQEHEESDSKSEEGKKHESTPEGKPFSSLSSLSSLSLRLSVCEGELKTIHSHLGAHSDEIDAVRDINEKECEHVLSKVNDLECVMKESNRELERKDMKARDVIKKSLEDRTSVLQDMLVERIATLSRTSEEAREKVRRDAECGRTDLLAELNSAIKSFNASIEAEEKARETSDHAIKADMASLTRQTEEQHASATSLIIETQKELQAETNSLRDQTSLRFDGNEQTMAALKEERIEKEKELRDILMRTEEALSRTISDLSQKIDAERKSDVDTLTNELKREHEENSVHFSSIESNVHSLEEKTTLELSRAISERNSMLERIETELKDSIETHHSLASKMIDQTRADVDKERSELADTVSQNIKDLREETSSRDAKNEGSIEIHGERIAANKEFITSVHKDLAEIIRLGGVQEEKDRLALKDSLVHSITQLSKEVKETHERDIDTLQKQTNAEIIEMDKKHEGLHQGVVARLDNHNSQLQTHLEHLERHDGHLEKHDGHLEKHDGHLEKHDEELSNHSAQGQDHSDQLHSLHSSLSSLVARVEKDETAILDKEQSTIAREKELQEVWETKEKENAEHLKESLRIVDELASRFQEDVKKEHVKIFHEIETTKDTMSSSTIELKHSISDLSTSVAANRKTDLASFAASVSSLHDQITSTQSLVHENQNEVVEKLKEEAKIRSERADNVDSELHRISAVIESSHNSSVKATADLRKRTDERYDSLAKHVSETHQKDLSEVQTSLAVIRDTLSKHEVSIDSNSENIEKNEKNNSHSIAVLGSSVSTNKGSIDEHSRELVSVKQSIEHVSEDMMERLEKSKSEISHAIDEERGIREVGLDEAKKERASIVEQLNDGVQLLQNSLEEQGVSLSNSIEKESSERRSEALRISSELSQAIETEKETRISISSTDRSNFEHQLSQLVKNLEEEKVARTSSVSTLSTTLDAEIERCHDSIGKEKVAREESDTKIHEELVHVDTTIKEMLSSEKETRENEVSILQADLHKAIENEDEQRTRAFNHLEERMKEDKNLVEKQLESIGERIEEHHEELTVALKSEAQKREEAFIIGGSAREDLKKELNERMSEETERVNSILSQHSSGLTGLTNSIDTHVEKQCVREAGFDNDIVELRESIANTNSDVESVRSTLSSKLEAHVTDSEAQRSQDRVEINCQIDALMPVLDAKTKEVLETEHSFQEKQLQDQLAQKAKLEAVLQQTQEKMDSLTVRFDAKLEETTKKIDRVANQSAEAVVEVSKAIDVTKKRVREDMKQFVSFQQTHMGNVNSMVKAVEGRVGKAEDKVVQIHGDVRRMGENIDEKLTTQLSKQALSTQASFAQIGQDITSQSASHQSDLRRLREEQKKFEKQVERTMEYNRKLDSTLDGIRSTIEHVEQQSRRRLQRDTDEVRELKREMGDLRSSMSIERIFSSPHELRRSESYAGATRKAPSVTSSSSSFRPSSSFIGAGAVYNSQTRPSRGLGQGEARGSNPISGTGRRVLSAQELDIDDSISSRKAIVDGSEREYSSIEETQDRTVDADILKTLLSMGLKEKDLDENVKRFGDNKYAFFGDIQVHVQRNARGKLEIKFQNARGSNPLAFESYIKDAMKVSKKRVLK